MTTHIIDDHDPAVVFSPGWSQGGSGKEYNSTTSYTDSAGRNATLTFQGISVAVYGTIGSSNGGRPPPRTSYAIDGNTLVIYEPVLMSTAQQHQRFFQSAQLPTGDHTLVITTLRDNCDIYILDYFIVETSTSPSSSPTPSGNTMSDMNHPSRMAIIAGSTVAAIAGTLLILSALYFCLRRRNKKEADNNRVSSFWGNTSTVPVTNESIVGDVAPTHKTIGPANSNSSTYPSHQASSHRYSVAPPQYEPPLYDAGGAASVSSGHVSSPANVTTTSDSAKRVPQMELHISNDHHSTM